MNHVMIECPNTGEPVFTGVVTPETTYDDARMEDRTVRCPHCGEEHEWDKDDAWVDSSPEVPG